MSNQYLWWQEKPVYQVYPKSFLDTTGQGTGDLRGITAKLDYLRTLDVGAIWLTPVYKSPMFDNGYDVADYCSIDPEYGSMEDMDELLAEAKKRGIRIVMDLVYNHTSYQNAWFQESKKSRTNPKADWYIWRDPKPDGSEPTNWRSIFGKSAWTYCEERQQYYLHTFAPQQPDLNWENPEVRQALYDAANFWIKKGVGGFRIDAIVYIKKPAFVDGTPDGPDGLVNIHNVEANTPGILDFLHEFKKNVFDGHDIFTVAEANGVGPDDLKDWVGEHGVFSMLFEFSHMDLSFPDGEVWCHEKPWKLTQLKQALTASQRATTQNGWYPIFFENHDQPRCVNHFFPKDADRTLAAKAIATVLLTTRGTPFIYQGQEIGMENVAWPSIDCYNDISSHGQFKYALKEGLTNDEALAFVHKYSRDNARTPMQWTRGRQAGFTEGQPWLPVQEDYRSWCVEAEATNENSVLTYYRRLVRYRRDCDILRHGTYRELLPESEQIYAFARELDGRRIVTLVNFSLEEASYPEALVQGLERLDGSYPPEESRPGVLRPLEAVICVAPEEDLMKEDDE